MRTESLRVARSEREIDVELALPDASGPRPAVVVVHEIFGRDAHTIDVARRLAGAGYVAAAPELFPHDIRSALTPEGVAEALTALSAALDVPLASLGPVEHLPDLGQREHEALAQVSDEYDWSGSKALQVERAARMELARGGVRRLTFQTPDDWLRFDRRLSGSVAI